MPDDAAHTAPEFEADLGQLGRLPRSGLAGDDHDLMVADGCGKLGAVSADRKIGVTDHGHGVPARSQMRLGRRDLALERLQGLRPYRRPQRRQSTAQPHRVGESHTVQPRTQCAHVVTRDLGHSDEDRRG